MMVRPKSLRVFTFACRAVAIFEEFSFNSPAANALRDTPGFAAVHARLAIDKFAVAMAHRANHFTAARRSWRSLVARVQYRN
jgi:hypothetical protein